MDVQTFDQIEVREHLSVGGATQLARTTIRGALTVGDATTDRCPPVQLLGSLTVDGIITGKLHALIDQINASEGVINLDHLDLRHLDASLARLDQAQMISRIAIAVAIIAIVIAALALYLATRSPTPSTTLLWPVVGSLCLPLIP